MRCKGTGEASLPVLKAVGSCTCVCLGLSFIIIILFFFTVTLQTTFCCLVERKKYLAGSDQGSIQPTVLSWAVGVSDAI